jgi:hypothetical protein
MDALAIATQAIAFIKPLLTKGVDSFGEEAGKDFWPFIKSIFKNKNKEELTNKMENGPVEDSTFAIAQAHLQSILLDSPELTTQVANKLEEKVKSGIYQKVTGTKTVTIGNTQNSTITISQH